MVPPQGVNVDNLNKALNMFACTHGLSQNNRQSEGFFFHGRGQYTIFCTFGQREPIFVKRRGPKMSLSDRSKKTDFLTKNEI